MELVASQASKRDSKESKESRGEAALDLNALIAKQTFHGAALGRLLRRRSYEMSAQRRVSGPADWGGC